MLLKSTIIILTTLYLASCATYGLNDDEVKVIDNAQYSTDDILLSDSHRYRIDYLVDDEIYIYLIYQIKSTYRYIQVLASKGKIISVSNIDRYDSRSPDIERCTLFPAHEQLDVKDCLRKFTENVISVNDKEWLDLANSIDESEEETKETDLYQGLFWVAILSPVIVPVTIAASPFLIGDSYSRQLAHDSFTLSLGKNDTLAKIINNIPDKQKSIDGSKGTFYYEAGSLISFPAIGVGFENDTILWIQKAPNSRCGGGFMFWGLQCMFGKHDDNHF